MKVLGYCRVLTAEQASNGDSLDTQRQQITGYTMIKGWPIAEFFIENGVSASVPLADRPEGKRLLEAAAKGDVIVMARFDRAFGSASDALGTLEELKDQRIGLHMIDLGGDVCGNGISKLVFTILSAVAENEGDRIRDMKRHLASQGIYGGGKKPFGLDVVEAGDDKRLVPNPHEQAALACMKAFREQGQTLRPISKTIAVDFDMPELAAVSVKRILDHEARLGAAMLTSNGAAVEQEPQPPAEPASAPKRDLEAMRSPPKPTPTPAKPRGRQQTMTLAGAVADAMSRFQELAGEMTQVAKRLREHFSETQRYQIVSETADTLENIKAPEIAEGLAALTVTVPQPRKRLNRPAERDYACGILEACIEALEAIESEEAGNLKKELAEIIDTTGNAEFPGMYG